jgi:polyhydroxyalkanoate synthesis regulator phasin
MKVSQPAQIVDLEEEDPREKVNLDMVEIGTSIVEVEKESKLQSEGSSRIFSSKKYIFKTSESTYHSREDLAKQYVEKGDIALGEMRDLVPEVENISQHKSSLFTVRDVEKRTFNIAVADEDKVSEIKIIYDNISAPDKVKFHKHISDMLYYDYLSLSMKNSKISSYAMKLEGQLRQEKASSRAWQTQFKAPKD